jgi:hypothetical protein
MTWHYWVYNHKRKTLELGSNNDIRFHHWKNAKRKMEGTAWRKTSKNLRNSNFFRRAIN